MTSQIDTIRAVRSMLTYAARLSDDPVRATLAIYAAEAAAYGASNFGHADTAHDGGKWFSANVGAYGETRVLLYVDDSRDVIEVLGEVLAAHAPGAFVVIDWEEARIDAIMEGHDPADEGFREIVEEIATRDLTYTESGYLASWEWTMRAADPCEWLDALAEHRAHLTDALAARPLAAICRVESRVDYLSSAIFRRRQETI